MSDASAAPPLSGFTLVKNATIHEYPVEASLRSALQLCDEVVVNVGESDDDTLQRVRSVDDGRLRILRREWPDPSGTGLRELSDETNRALSACRHDWALYLQADEVLHEDDVPKVREALGRARAHPEAEGLLFDYLHFHGSPRWVLEGRRRYRREVRVVRRGAGVRSVRDAQGFRIGGAGGRKLRVLESGARVFHYAYVKSRRGLDNKRRIGAVWDGRGADDADPFVFYDYAGLRRFEGRHPSVAREWLRAKDCRFDPEEGERPPLNLGTLKVRVSDAIERWTGHRLFETRNYRLLE